MPMPTHVTSKGQVTIPKKIRDFLGIKPGSAVNFELRETGDVVLRAGASLPPEKSSRFAKLRGTATVKMSTEEILALTRDED